MKKMLSHPLFWIFGFLLAFGWAVSHQKSVVAAPAEMVSPIEVIPPSKWLCSSMADDGSKKCVRAIQTRNVNGVRMELMVQLVEVKDKKAVSFFPFDSEHTEALDDVDFGDSITIVTE